MLILVCAAASSLHLFSPTCSCTICCFFDVHLGLFLNEQFFVNVEPLWLEAAGIVLPDERASSST